MSRQDQNSNVRISPENFFVNENFRKYQSGATDRIPEPSEDYAILKLSYEFPDCQFLEIPDKEISIEDLLDNPTLRLISTRRRPPPPGRNPSIDDFDYVDQKAGCGQLRLPDRFRFIDPPNSNEWTHPIPSYRPT